MNPELQTFPTQNVPFTAGRAYSAGEMVKVGNRYGRVVDDTASGDVGMIAVRGIFSCAKATKADTWADGADLEFVVAETTNVLTVQALAQGVCGGKAWGATTANDDDANIELMPELN
jgi:predicted RecA/RadA family phage recombinase